jgi:hypothetical protein
MTVISLHPNPNHNILNRYNWLLMTINVGLTSIHESMVVARTVAKLELPKAI